ncbi:MAG: hypothetical protein AAFW73_22915 [Bacteroidota bacterium]
MLEDLLVQLLNHGIAPLPQSVAFATDWDLHYRYVPWNLDGSVYDRDYFELSDPKVHPRSAVELEIPQLTDRNVEEYRTSLVHLLRLPHLYETEMLRALCTYTFGQGDSGRGFELAKQMAERADQNPYTPADFIRRSCYPEAVVIHDVGENGFKYLTCYFHCAWDEEHGASVIQLAGKSLLATAAGTFAGRSGQNLRDTLAYELRQ